jgi:SH3-like domain-containing protein
MKRICCLLVLGLALLSIMACRSTKPAKDHARINIDRVEVRKTRATLSEEVAQLHRGDEVDILARESHWLRIRTKGGDEGWIEENAALSQSIVDAEAKVVAETQTEVAQAVGELSSFANLHVEPGRETPVFIRLGKGEKVQIFERKLTEKPTTSGSSPAPAPEPPRKDAWLKIRTERGVAGWVYSPSVDFSVPDEIEQYAESRRIVAWQVLSQLDLDDGKKVNQYVVADVASGVSPEYDFDRIRVFTWNKKRSRYETAFRENRIAGFYPIRVFSYQNSPAFEIVQWDMATPDAKKITSRYFMSGVLVRRIDAENRPHPETSRRHRRSR